MPGDAMMETTDDMLRRLFVIAVIGVLLDLCSSFGRYVSCRCMCGIKRICLFNAFVDQWCVDAVGCQGEEWQKHNAFRFVHLWHFSRQR